MLFHRDRQTTKPEAPNTPRPFGLRTASGHLLRCHSLIDEGASTSSWRLVSGPMASVTRLLDFHGLLRTAPARTPDEALHGTCNPHKNQ
jgi:hypothetical protein